MRRKRKCVECSKKFIIWFYDKQFKDICKDCHRDHIKREVAEKDESFYKNFIQKNSFKCICGKEYSLEGEEFCKYSNRHVKQLFDFGINRRGEEWVAKEINKEARIRCKNCNKTSPSMFESLDSRSKTAFTKPDINKMIEHQNKKREEERRNKSKNWWEEI